MDGLAELDATELLDGYRSRRISPVEVVDALARRIDGAGSLGAFNALCIERAQAEARAAEAAYAKDGATGALLGVPFAAKDIFDSEGVRTTYGSPMFADHVPGADAEAVRRARGAGAIMLGKAQTHEFAWGITSVNRALGTSHNPWAPERISGGSSGGSAVAVAAGLVPIALGTDTGGSIRVPSCFCGTVGLKPTHGRVSVAGVWPLARTLDHPGPIARTPRDAALLLAAIAGRDPADAATAAAPDPPPADDPASGDLAGATIGLCPALHRVALGPAAQAAFDAAVKTLQSLGARVVEVEFPEAERIHPAFVALQRAEALQTHRAAGLFPARAAEYGADVRRRLEGSTGVTIEDYLSASAERDAICARFARTFAAVDLLLTPISAGSPPPIGSERVIHEGRELPFREFVMTYTVPQDIAGLPACAVRAGFDDLGIPIGVQLTGPWWSERRVLRAAAAFTGATEPVQSRRPPPARAPV